MTTGPRSRSGGAAVVAWAQAHGAHAETVSRTEVFPAALDRALAVPGPAVVHLPVDPDRLTPDTTVDDEAAPGRAGGP